MDNTDEGEPFSDNAPFRHPTVNAHLLLMTISFLACYPLALIQGARRHRRYQLYTLAGGSLVALVGYVAAWSSPYTPQQQPIYTLLSILGYVLFVLIIGHIGLTLYSFYYGGEKQQQLVNNKETWWMRLTLPLEESLHLVIGWIVVLTGYAYLVIAIIASTGTCSSSIDQCLMPLAMGSGFLGYGTLVLLHLVNVLNLPRASTPEYYEALILTLWGVVCLVMSGVPVLGSEWRAVNIGLIWFTGGLFSIAISMQTWMVALRERNIVNTLILCLTGRAVIVGRAQDDAFTSEVHVMLGYLLITTSVFRFIQIIFRKTPIDNLPQLLARTSSMDQDDFSDEHDETRRANDYQSAYRQLTGQSPTCKHTWLFASITIISGMLTAFLAIASGILFMGANVEWTSHMRYYLNDPSTYVNAIIAVAFLWATYIFILCTIYNNIHPMSSSYYEYLGLSTLEPISTGATCPSPTSTVVDDQHTTSAQQYEEQRFNNLHRSKSLPARRGIEEPPTMRPSQYRAKRRSLLLQSPQQDSNGKKQQQRARSASTVNGVGGVLPDDLDSTAYMSRRSWLSNGSATSTGTNGSFGSASSSATTSPPLPNSAPPIDLSTSTTASSSSHPHRRTVLFSDEPAGMAGTYDDEHFIRKTESGRRKERVKKQLGQDPSTTDIDVSSSESQNSVAKYYSSERNSSDSNQDELDQLVLNNVNIHQDQA